MSAPCENIVQTAAPHGDIPVCAHLLLITCRANGGGCICLVFQWCWLAPRVCCVYVCVCETNIFSADSVVCEKLQPWTITPVTWLPVWNTPQREGERQSSCVSCLPETSESLRGQMEGQHGCQGEKGGKGKSDCRENEMKKRQWQGVKAPVKQSVEQLTYCHNH